MSSALTGRVAIVTGAGRGGRGIGRGIAVALASAGADIVITARTNIADAEAVAAECTALGVKSMAVVADISDESSVEALFKTTMESSDASMFSSIMRESHVTHCCFACPQISGTA